MDSNLIKHAIRSSWGPDTAYPMEKYPFLTGHLSTGQCAVSAAVLRDYIGGGLQKGLVNGSIRHYWNNIGGEVIDLTWEQFSPSAVVTDIQEADPASLMGDADFCRRYQILKTRTTAFIEAYESLEKDIAECSACGKAVEHFANRTISFGNKGDILIVGEAPAKNGWRFSGIAWKTVDGRTLPSGKRLNQLLSLCGLDLFDCNFLEVVKCYPQSSRDLAYCGRNCHSFLERQISLLSPRLILTLGKVPAQIMFSGRAPLSELVGKSHTLVIERRNFSVFPIYHPSPISPKSWNDNLMLIPALRAALKEGEPCPMI